MFHFLAKVCLSVRFHPSLASFLFLSVLFSFFQFRAFRRLHVFGMRVARSILIYFGILTGSMAYTSSTVDHGDLPPYAVMQDIDRYDAPQNDCQFAAMGLAGDSKRDL